MIRVGIVGYGTSATVFHIPLMQIEPELSVVAVASSRPDDVRADFPDVTVYPTVEVMLKDSTLQLIVVASPTFQHFSDAKLALAARRHVVIEKPMTVTVTEADQLIDLVRANGVSLSVFHNRRWDNGTLTIEDLITRDVLGEVAMYSASFNRFRPVVQDRWREQAFPGSGIVYDLASHLLFGALHLFGVPDWVSADIQRQRPNAEVDDYFHVELGCGTRRVLLHADMMTMDNDLVFAVHGSKGSYVKYGLDPQEDALKAGGIPGSEGWGEESAERMGLLTTADGRGQIPNIPGSYQSFYPTVIDAIENGATTNATMARNVIVLIEAAFRSSQEARRIHL